MILMRSSVISIGAVVKLKEELLQISCLKFALQRFTKTKISNVVGKNYTSIFSC